ncbi:FAD-dependent oxidoreductase [Microbacterium sp. Clip185]|uniref:FAD-dependent oxidoreductase n=1 Tax=Microbacterium sp. Clip185 TaxID=3025663 RepID=UPI002365F54E|nr:FAD-dependent oxidoreductase [Microbacterium sp. Clip185]WDG16995.1 FAD-dependent oxidoreductase [Microbacterium sp. Clip185]
MRTLRTQVCIAGGGPGGIMLGLLLARAGVEVVVLEKHADFFRDFRGDTVHPSTLDIIDALGLRQSFDAIEHRPLDTLDAVVNGVRLHAIDFRTLRGTNRILTLMPQWDLLDLLADAARHESSFTLLMGADVTGVVRAGSRVSGVHAATDAGPLRVDAALVVAADGRGSTLREAVGVAPVVTGVGIDVLWFRLPEPAAPVPDTLAWLSGDGMLITIPRPGYFQCGLVVGKGSFGEIRGRGIDAFRMRVARAAPPIASELGAVASFDDVKLLSVEINHLRRWWQPGLLFIGDAAHAMSPAFGVGINYAIQDAVAAARLLAPALGGGPVAIDRACAALQRRRALPTRAMQRLQQVVHRAIGRPRPRILHNPPTRRERIVLRIAIPIARRLLPRLVGYGFRPERIAPDERPTLAV